MLIKQKFKAGVSLIETMIVLLILAVSITAITSLVVQISSFTYSTQLKRGALLLAEDSLEQVRSYYQKSGWAFLQSKTGNCYKDGSLAVIASGCSSVVNSVYSRGVDVSVNGAKITVKSFIYYQDKDGLKTTELDTYFYNY